MVKKTPKQNPIGIHCAKISQRKLHYVYTVKKSPKQSLVYIYCAKISQYVYAVQKSPKQLQYVYMYCVKIPQSDSNMYIHMYTCTLTTEHKMLSFKLAV
jgi:hypothetical protein